MGLYDPKPEPIFDVLQKQKQLQADMLHRQLEEDRIRREQFMRDQQRLDDERRRFMIGHMLIQRRMGR